MSFSAFTMASPESSFSFLHVCDSNRETDHPPVEVHSWCSPPTRVSVRGRSPLSQCDQLVSGQFILNQVSKSRKPLKKMQVLCLFPPPAQYGHFTHYTKSTLRALPLAVIFSPGLRSFLGVRISKGWDDFPILPADTLICLQWN